MKKQSYAELAASRASESERANNLNRALRAVLESDSDLTTWKRCGDYAGKVFDIESPAGARMIVRFHPACNQHAAYDVWMVADFHRYAWSFTQNTDPNIEQMREVATWAADTERKHFQRAA